MNLYLSSTVLWNYPVDQVISIAEQYGFRGVEVWAEQVRFHQTSAESIITAKEKYHMDLTFHAPSWDLNLCAMNEGVRKQSVHEIEQSMELASRIGARNMTIHPGKRTLTRDWTSWHFDRLIESLAYLAEKAQEFDVVLSVEQMEHEKKEFITTPDMINQLIHQLPSTVQVTFDIAHVPIEADLQGYYEQIERINKIHLSDASSNAYHLPLGNGEVDFEALLNRLEKTDLPVVLEGYDHAMDHQFLQANLSVLQPYLAGRSRVENFSY
ncbi:sugar phosphate isomerase/epimerase [Ammoniphilus sp. CFH 90114]|uniref:sugar phosphate isomerase/epimerase family protein n=1 Tax=Ammoniphilus sp. CFH 90114 TaxID=2493665 RepID=UPI00100DB98F|nr:sugar phosphate isomerase/epimerase family protein [Ammoniphilus sp. CFH 90114]RXT04351.1 sugar phosphate isomerase/epimerase [Ammoniphilus sp. CFH 90114]